MINTLPPEVIKTIVYQLSMVVDPELYNKKTTPFGYYSLLHWNSFSRARDLARLAQTCKYLQSVLYPVMYDGAAVWAPKTEYRVNSELFRIEEMTKQFHHSAKRSDSVLNYSTKPQFAARLCVDGISTNVAKYIRCLFLKHSPSNGLYLPVLAQVLPKMTSLAEATLVLEPGLDCQDVAKTIDCLREHKNASRVHLHVALITVYTLDEFSAFMGQFQNEWAPWTKLNVESIVIDIKSRRAQFPQAFLDQVKGLDSLKKFVIRAPNGEFGFDRVPTDPVSNTVALSRLPQILQALPNLKEFELEFVEDTFSADAGTDTDAMWVPGPRLETLTMPLEMFTPAHTATMFDTITHFELINESDLHDVKPPLRNLTALALYNFSAKGITPMLQHFVATNPGLVNLALFDSDVKISHAALKPLLAKIERLELHQTDSLMFQDVIQCASPVLRYFYYDPRYVSHVHDGATDDFLPLDWFAGEVDDGHVHRALQKIHMKPDAVLPDKYSVGVKWAKSLMRHILEPREMKHVLFGVVPAIGGIGTSMTETFSFVIDVNALRHILEEDKFGYY